MTQVQCQAVRDRLEWCLQRPASPEAAEELVAQLAAVDMLEKAMELHKSIESHGGDYVAHLDGLRRFNREWRGEGERP